ncbi:MAG TPA: hypothetical protein VHU61_01560 [Solirubrobacteraceae bacterium]|nr:hypothetical protein [Solirubrobacteraceae bacterium]
MTTLVVIHEVEDVEAWLASSRRDELFAPLGMTARAFRDPAGSNWVALIAEAPDVDEWHRVRGTDEAIEAMLLDGLRLETIVELVEAE